MDNTPFTRKSLLTTLTPLGRRGRGGYDPQLRRGGGALLIMAYTWRLHPKGVPFCQASGIKGREICQFGL